MFRTTATMGGNHCSKDLFKAASKNRDGTSPNSLGQRIPSGLVRYGKSWYIHIYPYIYIIIYISHMRFSSTTLPQDQVVSVTITFGSLIPHF